MTRYILLRNGQRIRGTFQAERGTEFRNLWLPRHLLLLGRRRFLLRNGRRVRGTFQGDEQVHRRLGAQLVDYLGPDPRVRDAAGVDVGHRDEVGLAGVLAVGPHDVGRYEDLGSNVLLPAPVMFSVTSFAVMYLPEIAVCMCIRLFAKKL